MKGCVLSFQKHELDGALPQESGSRPGLQHSRNPAMARRRQDARTHRRLLIPLVSGCADRLLQRPHVSGLDGKHKTKHFSRMRAADRNVPTAVSTSITRYGAGAQRRWMTTAVLVMLQAIKNPLTGRRQPPNTHLNGLSPINAL